MLGLSTIGFSGPVVEIYECQINKGKTLEDLSDMMDTFSAYLKKAGLSDSYKAHAGFQQIPIKPISLLRNTNKNKDNNNETLTGKKMWETKKLEPLVPISEKILEGAKKESLPEPPIKGNKSSEYIPQSRRKGSGHTPQSVIDKINESLASAK